MDNFTNGQFDPKDALRQLRKANSTNTWLRWGLIFILAIVPIIAMFTATTFGPEYSYGSGWNTATDGAMISVATAWMISGLTLLGATAVSIFLSIVSSDVKTDIIAPVMGISFANMILFSTPYIALWGDIILWFVLAFLMTSVFSIFVIIGLAFIQYKKMQKQIKSMTEGNPMFDGQNPQDVLKNLFGAGGTPFNSPFNNDNNEPKPDDGTIDVDSKEKKDESKDKIDKPKDKKK